MQISDTTGRFFQHSFSNFMLSCGDFLCEQNTYYGMEVFKFNWITFCPLKDIMCSVLFQPIVPMLSERSAGGLRFDN